MDKFEEAMANMAKMTPDELDKMMKGAEAACICPSCPSYNDCAREKGELLFCAKGKSSCGMMRLGCICPDCPVAEQLGLKFNYYCMKGSERSLRGMG